MIQMLPMAKYPQKISLIDHHAYEKEMEFGAFSHTEFLPGPVFQPFPNKNHANKVKMNNIH